jgi:hydrogenase maturation protein HypF
VYALAARLGLAGGVANDSAGVIVEIEGERVRAAQFMTSLERDAPPLALIERTSVTGAPTV